MNKIELAKCKIALHAPEFISLTSKLEFVEDYNCPTAGTDGRRISYNPEWIKDFTLQQTIGLILHEVGHNVLAHMSRIAGRDKRVANIAMDIVLNENLKSYFDETRNTLNAEFPAGDLTPGPQWEKYKGWNWEKVYGDFVDNATQLPQQFDYVEPGTNEDGTPMSASQQEALAKEWTMAAQQAATMAKARGLHSAFFESFISGLTETKVDWRAQVLDIATKTAKDDQSWRRFNRKFIHAETYLPSMYSETIGRVGFFTDTSGSMGDETFKIGLSGMNEILETLQPSSLVFGCCDTQMQSVEELTCDDLPVVAKSFKGRGGTVLTPIFEYVKTLDDPLELVVVLSDGQCEEIAKNLEPCCPVVWLLTTDYKEAVEASFGKVIRVEA